MTARLPDSPPLHWEAGWVPRTATPPAAGDAAGGRGGMQASSKANSAASAAAAGKEGANAAGDGESFQPLAADVNGAASATAAKRT